MVPTFYNGELQQYSIVGRGASGFYETNNWVSLLFEKVSFGTEQYYFRQGSIPYTNIRECETKYLGFPLHWKEIFGFTLCK